MLNEQRIEHLRLAVQASTLLDDHEKADWLNLLELMNDKQLGELEEILAGPPPAIKQAASISPTPTGSSSLSHISNLPKEVRNPASGQRVEPVIGDSPSLIKAKPAPPPASQLKRTTVPKVINPQPLDHPTTVTPPPPLRSASKLPPMNPLVLKDLSSVQTLGVNAIRQHEQNSVINALQMIAQSYGYFSTLQNLESSPLYTAYLTAGKNRLAGQPDSTLSQAEFELVADMLQAMRLNRA